VASFSEFNLPLLRAHGLIRKIPGACSYPLSDTGHKAVGAVLTALRPTFEELIPKAT
jgi:hypothetical protein